jgi:hypothetical protein
MRMPPVTAASFSRRISLAWRNAMATVASGFSFVPALVSLPLGETYISPACRDIATKRNKQKEIALIGKPI